MDDLWKDAFVFRGEVVNLVYTRSSRRHIFLCVYLLACKFV